MQLYLFLENNRIIRMIRTWMGSRKPSLVVTHAVRCCGRKRAKKVTRESTILSIQTRFPKYFLVLTAQSLTIAAKDNLSCSCAAPRATTSAAESANGLPAREKTKEV